MVPADPDLLVPPFHFGFLVSPILVVVLGLLVPGVGFALTLGRGLAARAWKVRAERAQADETTLLAGGPAVVVGEVLTEESDSPEPGVAIKVLVTQHVDGSIAREVRRQTLAGPFYLRTAGGEIVRVEPGVLPTLAAELERERSPEPHAPRALRFRAARLRQGERAICAGHLHRGYNPRGSSTYRAAEGGWVLSPGRGSGNMWISGGTLASVFAKKARFFFVYAAYFACLFVAAQLAFVEHYRLSVGDTERCTVMGVLNPEARMSRTPLIEGQCDAQPLQKSTILREAARPALVELVATNGDGEVRVTRVRAGKTTMLGPVPTLSWLRVGVLCGLALLGFLFAVGLGGRSSRSWYESRRFVETVNGAA